MGRFTSDMVVRLLNGRQSEYQKKQEEKKVADSVSKHVGEVGQRISFKIADAVALTSWETEWGYTTLWKIIDESGNVFTCLMHSRRECPLIQGHPLQVVLSVQWLLKFQTASKNQ